MADTQKVKLVSTTMAEPQFINELINNLEDEVEAKKLCEMLRQPEGLMVYTARVSSPNQEKTEYASLINYCIKHGHWSIFEMCDMMVEIQTSRGIAPQILRHRSFNFQEFSQRYAAVGEDGIIVYAARRQDKKNRQNSIDDMTDALKEEWERRQLENWKRAFEHYKWALDHDIAKEQARFVLPLGTKTKLYMKGSIRSWIHYVDLRGDAATQKEHRDIALAIKDIICERYPTIALAKGWLDDE